MLGNPTRLDMRRARLLVVDDNTHSRELLLEILAGFRVQKIRACGSAEEAREATAIHTFDLILVDGEMPQEDGFSLTRHIRQDATRPNSTAPILLLSAHTPIQKVLLARDAGASMVVKKPAEPRTLLSRIEWLANDARSFIRASEYAGPDRRVRNLPLPDGLHERRADAIALTAVPEREMSQGDIDALFG